MSTENSDKNGWIRLHRRIIDSRLWSCTDSTFRVAVYLLLSANHDKRWVRRVLIERGQCVRSLTQISADCNVTRNTTRYALKILKQDGFLSIDEPFGTQQGHRITICNYDTYQDDNGNNHTGTTHGLTHGLTTNKNVKNDKKEKTPPVNPPAGDGLFEFGATDEKKNGMASSFKTWTREEFIEQVKIANHDGLLTPDEFDDFVSYWMEPNEKGKARRCLEKTWDTRRRMQTALRVVFRGNRLQRPSGHVEFTADENAKIEAEKKARLG